MDGYLSIFQGILSTEKTFLDIYLGGLEEHWKLGMKYNEGIELVQHISSLLTKSSTRELGLRLLNKFIDYCSIDVLEKKGDLWLTLILKACNNQELQWNAPLIFEVLGKILKRLQQSSDFGKSFASTKICKVYEGLTNASPFQAKYAFRCIEICLRAYPGLSGSSRGIIERFLWKHLDHLDSEVVERCGKCFHLLQQVKVGLQGVNHKTQWRNYQLKLLDSIHNVYNEMFANCTELYEGKIEQKKISWEIEKCEFDPEPVKKAAQMYTRCHNMIKYLVIALREPFSVEKPIFLKKILNVVVRGLSVNCTMLEQNPIADNISLSILLPMLHVDLLELLNVLVLILRGHLRPYSELILGLIVDTLKRTSLKNANEEEKQLLILRKKIYETVSMWCKIFNSGNRCEIIAEYLLKEILSDITPTQTEFTLKVLSGARKHMSKKARRQLLNAQNEKSNIAQTISSESNGKEQFLEERNRELCISALRCLREILFSVANFLKPTTLKMMQTSIIKICAVLYELPPKPSHLYSDNNCRLEIYNTLYAILMTPHHLCPPPTQLIITIIQTAYTLDDSLKVRIRCGFILQNLEKIIHPQKESLLCTIEWRDIRNTFTKMGHESLLREFEFNFLNTDACNVIMEENNVLKLNGTTSPELLCTLSNNHDGMKHTISENIEQTKSEGMNAADGNLCEIVNVYVTDIIEMEPLNDSELTSRETNNTNNDINKIPESPEFVLRVDDDGDVAIGDEKHTNTDNRLVDEPAAKMQKLEHFVDKSEMDKTENVNHIINIEGNECNLLADIASQFVDELD